MSRRNSSTPSQPNNQRNIPPSSTTRSNRPQRFNLIVPADITASIGQISTTPQPQANAARTSSIPTTPRHPLTPRPQVNTARTSQTPSIPSTPKTPKTSKSRYLHHEQHQHQHQQHLTNYEQYQHQQHQ